MSQRLPNHTQFWQPHATGDNGDKNWIFPTVTSWATTLSFMFFSRALPLQEATLLTWHPAMSVHLSICLWMTPCPQCDYWVAQAILATSIFSHIYFSHLTIFFSLLIFLCLFVFFILFYLGGGLFLYFWMFYAILSAQIFFSFPQLFFYLAIFFSLSGGWSKALIQCHQTF